MDIPASVLGENLNCCGGKTLFPPVTSDSDGLLSVAVAFFLSSKLNAKCLARMVSSTPKTRLRLV